MKKKTLFILSRSHLYTEAGLTGALLVLAERVPRIYHADQPSKYLCFGITLKPTPPSAGELNGLKHHRGANAPAIHTLFHCYSSHMFNVLM